MEAQILDLFLFNHKLKFSEIAKKLDTRTNKLSYHIKNLVKKGILENRKGYYKLSEKADYLIPYLSSKKAVLPVILIVIKNNKNQVFLYKRQKRPYKNYLSLPGGRLILGESISQSVKRIMREKFNINAKFEKTNSISLEHVKKKSKIIHSFLLILTTASTKDKIVYTDIKDNKSKNNKQRL